MFCFGCFFVIFSDFAQNIKPYQCVNRIIIRNFVSSQYHPNFTISPSHHLTIITIST
ncbi:hypothetical protein HMPREF0673_02130 [Leyella stercorea DSM 18206]|uniref:Uncharacterized protein n=1 Tax=Leyella stercorea DSM 18206 TaxID=1002367 RepID=G6AZR3_9BACT|nr:hypothetical protein HMPREF0673_02130 [Leyella stercorea DSM 18206]